MKYFLPPYTHENIQKQFRELSKKLHPDKNGNEELFKEMLQEKKNLLSAITKHIPKNSPGKKKRYRKTKIKNVKLHIVIDANDLINKFLKRVL